VTVPGAPGRVIVVGSVNVDQVVTVDRLPAPGETVTGGRYAQHHGGKGGNQAVAAARLGAPTWFVGAVGDDDLGTQALTALAVDDIDLSEAQTLPGETTGIASILVDSAGENLIAVASGANAALTPDTVRAALGRLVLSRGDVVLVGHEIPTATAVEALRMGRTAGAVTILNPAPAIGLTPAVLALADVLTPNRTEAAQLVGHAGDPEALAAELVGWLAGGGHVLLTLGAEGALLVGSEGAVRIPAPVVQAVDTVGAGDALSGALAASLIEGRTIEDAAYRAVAAASLATTRSGARGGMPTSAELATLTAG
jgi:ribokinase